MSAELDPLTMASSVAIGPPLMPPVTVTFPAGYREVLIRRTQHQRAAHDQRPGRRRELLGGCSERNARAAQGNHIVAGIADPDAAATVHRQGIAAERVPAALKRDRTHRGYEVVVQRG